MGPVPFLLQGEPGATAGILCPKGKQLSFGGSPENERTYLGPRTPPIPDPSLRPAVAVQITPHHLHLVHLVPLFCHLQLKHPDKLIPQTAGFSQINPPCRFCKRPGGSQRLGQKQRGPGPPECFPARLTSEWGQQRREAVGRAWILASQIEDQRRKGGREASARLGQGCGQK